MEKIQGLIFDKDGTLFDFRATWGGWSRQLLEELAGGARPLGETLARVIGFNPETGIFSADSPIIAQTPPEIAAFLLPHLPGADLATLVARMNALAALAEQVESVPLRPLFEGFRSRGLQIGLVTNDAELPARTHLDRAGIAAHFDFIAGFDSGHGAKPDPGPLLAFARLTGLSPDELAMVGDSRHDLIAGRAAGMRTVAVLTGIAEEAELAPFADVVLGDIGQIPAWLDKAA